MKYFAMMILGLHFLNTKNIIHRDIKPANFLLFLQNNNTIIKYGDFGTTKNTQVAVNIDLTQPQMGTEAYIAPEYYQKVREFELLILSGIN